MRSVFLLLLMLVPGLAYAAPAIDAQRVSEHVRILSSDSFGGRAPATAGGEKTVDYIVKAFEQAGLSPGSANNGWLQPVPVMRYTIVGPAKAAARTPKTLGHFEQGESLILYESHPGSHVDVKDAPLVFVGYGISAPEFAWDDLKGIDLKDRVAVVLLGEPDLGSADRIASKYSRLRKRLKVLTARGVAGVIFIYDPLTTGWLWPSAQSTYLQPQFEGMDEIGDKPSFEGLINTQAAAQLFVLAGQNLQALATAAQKRDFRPVALNATFSTSLDYRSERVTPPNVIGILRGAKRPDEYVIYSAHWDHLGKRTDTSGKDIVYSGAVDNASGVAALLEIARAMAAGPRPERSVVFLGTTLEEAGLLGARYYTQNPIYPLARTAVDLNFDMLMPFGRSRNVIIMGSGKTAIDRHFMHAARMVGIDAVPNADPGAGGYYRSDHFAFASAGVPSVFLQSGGDLVHGGVAAGRELFRDYMFRRYHQPADKWTPEQDYTGVAADAEIYLELGREIANSTDWPSWKDGVEFKAVRDETESARGAR